MTSGLSEQFALNIKQTDVFYIVMTNHKLPDFPEWLHYFLCPQIELKYFGNIRNDPVIVNY